MLQMWFGRSLLQQIEQHSDKSCDGGPGAYFGHGAGIREVVNIHGLPGQDVLFTIIASQLLDHVDDESVEHLSDCSNVTLEKYGDGPVIVTGHGVQEPSAGRRGAVQLLGQHLHPLDDVQLLLGVDERLQEEGHGEPVSLLAPGTN